MKQQWPLVLNFCNWFPAGNGLFSRWQQNLELPENAHVLKYAPRFRIGIGPALLDGHKGRLRPRC